MKQRTDKLLAAMPGGFEAALVSTDVNRFYFLGFDSGDAGTVLILPDKTYFIIDSRYIEIAEATVKEAEVILEGKALEQVRDILAAHGVKHLYLENKATLAYADRVRAALPGVEVDTGAVLSDAIDAIRACQPNAVIYIQGLIPLNEDVIAQSGGPSYLTNEHLLVYNDLMRKAAEEKQVVFLDLNPEFTGADGKLPADASKDGVHLRKAYCEKWLDYLKTHTVDYETLYPGQEGAV